MALPRGTASRRRQRKETEAQAAGRGRRTGKSCGRGVSALGGNTLISTSDKPVIIWSNHGFMGVPDARRHARDRRSVLATIGQLRESLVLSAPDREAAQAVAAGLRDAKAANTRRVYASAWHEFNVWALANGRQSMPAEPQTVVLYLGHLAADGKAMATIAQARAATSHAHAAQGMQKGDNPARHPAVAEVLKGWRNQAPAPKQAERRC